MKLILLHMSWYSDLPQFHTSLLDSNQSTEKSGQGFNVSQQKFAYTESESDCYKEMPGKSTITFLNDDKDLFQVDSYNCEGFRINQGNAFILGEFMKLYLIKRKLHM